MERLEQYKEYAVKSLEGDQAAIVSLQINILAFEVLGNIAMLNMYEDLVTGMADATQEVPKNKAMPASVKFVEDVVKLVQDKKNYVISQAMNLLECGLKKEDILEISKDPIFVDLASIAIMEFENKK